MAILMDNLADDGFGNTWERVRGLNQEDNTAEAKRMISELSVTSPNSSQEQEWAIDAFRRAISLGRVDRLHVWGLSKGDILEYLDQAAFELKEERPELRRQYEQHSDRRPFKEWLRRYKSASISIATIGKAAANTSDHPPSELIGILSKCRELGGRTVR